MILLYNHLRLTCGESFVAQIKDIVNGTAKCPYCNKTRVLLGFNSLKAENLKLSMLISPENELDADHILPSKHTIHKWRCSVCGGDFNASTLQMENGYTCPYCDDKLPLKGFNSSYKTFWWICSKNSTHKYPMSPRTMLMFKNREREPCLFCRGQRRKLSHFVEYDPYK